MKNKAYYPWIIVALLWVVALLNFMDRQMLSTMRYSMMVDIKELEQATNFGRLMAVFLWIYAFMSPLAGMIADKINRKWLIVGSLIVWSAVTMLMGYATSYNQLYILRALMGISEALYIPAGLAMIADYHQDKTRSLAVGIHMTGLYVGQSLGGFGATVASLYSWKSTFHLFGVAGIVYAVILIFFLREKKEHIEQDKQIKSFEGGISSSFKGLTLVVTNISFLIYLIYFTVPCLPIWATKNWLPTLISESFGIEMIKAGPLSTISMSASSFVGVIFGGILSDQWIQSNIRGRIYTGAIGVFLMIPALLFIGFGNTFAMIMSGGICFGIGFGIFDANNMPIMCQLVQRQHRATAYGIMNLNGALAGAFITDFLGKSSDEGNLGNHIALLSIVVLFSLAIQLTFLKPKPFSIS